MVQFFIRIQNLLFSTRLTGVLLILFAIAMATATFIENDYGTETSKALVYSAKWFEIVIVLLAINFTGNIAKYNLFSWDKAPVFLLHISFVIIIGAGITKYRGFEALVTIKEKQEINRILSIDSYLQVQVGTEKITKNFTSKPLMMSELGFNAISESYDFENKKIKVKLKEYVPRAHYILEESTVGYDYLHIVLSDDSQRKDFYLKKGTRDNFYGVNIAFETKEKLFNEIYIKEKESGYFVSFPKKTNYFSMLENKASFYPKDSLVPLKFKALSTINKLPLVFNGIRKNKNRKLIQKPVNKKVKNPESAVVLNITSGDEEKEITLLGGKGYMNPAITTFINGLHLKLRYGSKPIQLPFSLYLKDFILERYPGSDSPSAYYSEIEVRDNEVVFDKQIFMNNVLDYQGYRFFQSAYLPDESGTILSVNHDYWGTKITYLGYFLLTLGMILSLLWNTPFFKFIPKSKLV